MINVDKVAWRLREIRARHDLPKPVTGETVAQLQVDVTELLSLTEKLLTQIIEDAPLVERFRGEA